MIMSILKINLPSSIECVFVVIESTEVILKDVVSLLSLHILNDLLNKVFLDKFTIVLLETSGVTSITSKTFVEFNVSKSFNVESLNDV